jgi:hypothetical protein
MRSFSYENVAREAGIADDDVRRLCESVRREFPHDEMMYELHVLRVFMAIRDGMITLEDALRSDAEQPV